MNVQAIICYLSSLIYDEVRVRVRIRVRVRVKVRVRVRVRFGLGLGCKRRGVKPTRGRTRQNTKRVQVVGVFTGKIYKRQHLNSLVLCLCLSSFMSDTRQ